MNFTPPAMQPARQGAQNALAVPSLQPNGQRVPYKAPVAQCVGPVKEAVGFAR